MMITLFTIIGTLVPHVSAASWQKYCESLHWACADPAGVDFLARLANQAIILMNSFIGALAVLGVMWGAALIATSGANEDGRNKGKEIIKTVLIGTIAAILATNILGYIFYIFA